MNSALKPADDNNIVSFARMRCFTKTNETPRLAARGLRVRDSDYRAACYAFL